MKKDHHHYDGNCIIWWIIAGYRNINQKYPARKVETAEKGEFLEFWMELKFQRME